MYVVQLETDRLWITLANEPDGERIVCGSVQSSGMESVLDGDVRYYAGGRVQGVVRDQDGFAAPFTLRHLSPTEKDRLIAWRGQVVLVRTSEGERIFAFYLSVPHRRLLGTVPDDGSANVTYDADITFTRVSFREAV